MMLVRLTIKFSREVDGTESTKSKAYIICGNGDFLVDYDERGMDFPSGPTYSEIKKALGVSTATEHHREERGQAYLLIRRLRGEKLEEIGSQFGISKYSSVSSAIEKMKREISADRKLRMRVKNIEQTLHNSQQQTCSPLSERFTFQNSGFTCDVWI